MIVDSSGVVIEHWFEINLHSETCQEIDFHPNVPWIASAGWDNQVKIFDVNRRTVVYSHQMSDNIRYVQFSPDGQHLGVASGSMVTIFRVNVNLPKKPLDKFKEFPTNGQNCWTLGWSPNNRYFAYAFFDGTIHIIDTSTWIEARVLEPPFKTIVHIAFSPSSAFLASTGSKENDLVIWDLRSAPDTWKIHHRASNIPYEGRKCIWSKDGKYLFLCMWGTESYVYNTSDWIINTIIHSEDKGLGGDFSKDLQVLGLASESGHYIFYKLKPNTSEWVQLGSYNSEDSFPWDIKWSPHGQWIAANFHDGRLHLMRYSNSNVVF